MRFTISFTNGICRLARATEYAELPAECIMATKTMGVACKALDEQYRAVGGTSFTNGSVEFIWDGAYILAQAFGLAGRLEPDMVR